MNAIRFLLSLIAALLFVGFSLTLSVQLQRLRNRGASILLLGFGSPVLAALLYDVLGFVAP
jgi:hypothetical protein